MNDTELLDATIVDEIGIESGVIGDVRLESVYQPVFSLLGRDLHISAFDASIRLRRGHEDADQSTLEHADRGFVEALMQWLGIANYRNLALQERDLIIDHDPSAGLRLAQALAGAADQASVMGDEPLVAGRVVCRIRSASERMDESSIGWVEALRVSGFRVMLDAFEHDLEAIHAHSGFRPDLAEVNAARFGSIATRNAATSLLRPLVDAHRANGTQVHIRGIKSGAELELALTAGAQFLSGPYLAQPTLVGMPVDEDVVGVADLMPALRDATYRY